MSDLIDRQALKESIEKLYACDWKVVRDTMFIAQTIDEAPSVEPERKKGEWSNYKDEHCCSVCKCVVISACWDDEIRYDYCPHCGADMTRGDR